MNGYLIGFLILSVVFLCGCAYGAIRLVLDELNEGDKELAVLREKAERAKHAHL